MISQFNYIEERPEGRDAGPSPTQSRRGSLWAVLDDGGRIDLTTPRIRGTGGLH